MFNVNLSTGDATREVVLTRSPLSGRHRYSSFSHSSGEDCHDDTRLAHEPVQPQDRRAPKPSKPIPKSESMQKAPEKAGASSKARNSRSSWEERYPEEKSRKHRKQRVRDEDQQGVMRRQSAGRRRRVIPTAPHRQLFLVGDYYWGEGALDAQEHESFLAMHSRISRCGDNLGGVNREMMPIDALSTAASNRAGIHVPSPRGMPLHTPPPVLSGVQPLSNSLAIDSTQTGSSSHSAAAPSSMNTAAFSNSNRGHRKRKGPDKLRVRQRFYEPVELQVESMTAFAMRLTLVLWHACLVAALVVEVIPSVQWSMVNICGANHGVDLRYMDKWTSTCVTSSPTVAGNSTITALDTVSLRWNGSHMIQQRNKMERYRRVAFSLPPPPDQSSKVQVYNVVAENRISGNGVEWVFEYPLSIRCDRTKTRCDVARVPEPLLDNTPNFASDFSFTLTLVPNSLAAGAAGGSVGIAFQRSAYTVSTIVWRYTLIVFSLIHTLRFVVYCKYSSALYEQSWTIGLQVALMWYLDPLFALNITGWPLSTILAFMEYRIPTYFMAVLVAYMLSVMTASMMWARPIEAKPSDGVFPKLKAFLARSRNVCDPPMWTKILIFVYMLSIFLLDVVDACVNKYIWQLTSNSEVRLKRLSWLTIALQVAGSLVCLLLLFYLRDYLGKKPYLESRPQQLACRVFLMVFLSAVVYYAIHYLVFFLLYNHGYPALASQQPLLQLPMLMVMSFFVNIMTLVYTTQSRDESVPVNPRDPRWKHMVWPDTWYRWLARHGGSQYIFATEQEETRFYRLQFEFRRRQFMAKQKRLQNTGRTRPSYVSTWARSLSASTPWVCTQSPISSNTLSPICELQGDGFRATNLLPCDSGAFVPSRAGECVSPQPSCEMSAADTGDDADDAGVQQHEEPPTVRVNGCGTISSVRRDGRLCAPAARGASNPPVESRPSRLFNGDSSAIAAAPTLDMRSSGFWPSHGDVSSNGLVPVSVAARHIINMDRFSTYFLADGDGTADGGGGLAESYASIRREKSLTGDAFAIEGPARRRSRMLQNASAARGLDGRDGSVTFCRPSQHQATLAANALAQTYSGCDYHGVRTSVSFVPLELASKSQRHARSRSDGDGLVNSLRHAGAESIMRSCKTAPLHGTLPLVPRSRYQDPSAGAGLTGDTKAPMAAVWTPLQKATATSADNSVLPHTEIDREGYPDGTRRQDEVSFSTNNDTFVPHRAPLPSVMLPRQAPTADASDAHDGSNLEGTVFVEKDDPPFVLCSSPIPVPDTSCVEAASNVVEANARHRSVRGNTGSTLRLWNSGDGDALLDLSVRTVGDNDDASSSSSSSSSSSAHGGTRSLMRTLVLARDRLGSLIGTAERNLLERPVRGLDRLETHIFDAAYRPFQTIQYLPFFNLETSIDCFNISWEAYGVEEVTDDQGIEMRINMTPQSIPRTVANGIKAILCGFCPVKEDTEDDDTEDDRESDAERMGEDAGEFTGQIGGTTEGTAAVAPAMGGECTGQERHVPTSLCRRSSDTVIAHMRREDDNSGAAASPTTSTPAVAGKYPPSHSALPLTWIQSGEPASTSAATAVPDPTVLPINVEKYGFVRLLVAEAKAVQVLMVMMDTSAQEHKGKAPRVIIAFRGTANMRNAKYDMNIHRVVWREMEKMADWEAANAAGEEVPELSSTFEDGSTTTAKHLGCASCIHSCLRKTSWRPTCHAGFLTIWKTLKPTVLSRLREFLCNDRGTVYRIFTTGHSLGGALASLCAYSITCMLKRMDYPIADVTVYTYGQPRMGNQTFQRVYNKAVPRTFRIVNESDVVVHMFMFGGFHVGIEVDVDRNGNFIVKPTEIEKLFPPTKGRGLTVINHLMSSYAISLNAIASRTPCPARARDFYLTADPEKVEAEKEKMEETFAAQLHSQESRR